MAKVAGIKVEKIVKGKPTIVRIDLRKHPEFIPLLEEKGIFEKESPYDPKYVEMILSQKDEEAVVIKTKDLWKINSEDKTEE